MTLCTCAHCLESGELGSGDFSLDHDQKGFWCESCDRYTYLDTDAPRHSFKLILESKSATEERTQKPAIKFEKQLSPFRYPGGKSKIIDYLYQQLQPHQCERLVSPFSGGASFELAMLRSGVVKHLHLNDMDFGVYAFWRCVKEDPSGLIQKLKTITPTHTDYFNAQSQIKGNHPDKDLLKAAWSTLLVNRLAYSGIAKANPLGGRSGTQENLRSRWNPAALIQKINRIHELRDRITVTREDAVPLIEEAYWSDHTTLFIDPPYIQKGKALYPCFYTESDHMQLAWLLDSLHESMPGADILVTYDMHEFFDRFYEAPKTIELGRFYSV